MKDKVLQMLASQGVNLPPGASDDMVLGALYGGHYGKEVLAQAGPASTSLSNGIVEPLLSYELWTEPIRHPINF